MCYGLLVLLHGQVAVARGFSVKNKVVNVNMHEISITSHKLIMDHINGHSLLSQSFPITNSLSKSVRCSRQRYQEFLRERIVTETKYTMRSVSHYQQRNWGSEGLLLKALKQAKTVRFRWSWKEGKLQIVVKWECIEKKARRKTGWD